MLIIFVQIHAVTAHVDDWLKLSNYEKRLGCFSEQTFESVHHDFGRLWLTSYQIRDIHSPKYGDKLRRCVLRYNSRHIPLPADL